MGNKKWDNVIIIWSLYIFSPIILMFLLLFLVKGLSIILWYTELIQSITGFEDRSFLLLVAVGIPPIIILYLLYRLSVKVEKALKDRTPHNE